VIEFLKMGDPVPTRQALHGDIESAFQSIFQKQFT